MTHFEKLHSKQKVGPQGKHHRFYQRDERIWPLRGLFSACQCDRYSSLCGPLTALAERPDTSN